MPIASLENELGGEHSFSGGIKLMRRLYPQRNDVTSSVAYRSNGASHADMGKTSSSKRVRPL